MKYQSWIPILFLLGIVKDCTAGCESTTPCQNGGTCILGICNCPDGLSGDFCEIIECASDGDGADPCQNGGTCGNINGKGICNCLPGFSGNICEIIDNSDSSCKESSESHSDNSDEESTSSEERARSARIRICWILIVLLITFLIYRRGKRSSLSFSKVSMGKAHKYWR